MPSTSVLIDGSEEIMTVLRRKVEVSTGAVTGLAMMGWARSIGAPCLIGE
jgi:hypothetical protein